MSLVATLMILCLLSCALGSYWLYRKTANLEV